MTSPTESVVRSVVRADLSDLDDAVRRQARWVLLDAFACMLAAVGTPLGRTVLAQAAGAAGGVTVVGGAPTSPAMAAWANSSLQNLLDYDDTFAGFAHVGNAAVPAALAVAEAEHASGRELIDAIVVGFQASAGIGLALWPSAAVEHRYGVQTTWKVFAAVAAASRLLGLDQAATESAFGLAGTCAPPPMSRLRGSLLPRGWYKNNHGWGCLTGVFWTQMAARGAQGATRVLDDPGGFWVQAGSDRWEPAALLDPAWKDVHILGAEFKPYPCCRWAHPAIDGVLELVREHGFGADDVDRVDVEGFRARELSGYPPADVFDAQFSIPFLVARTIHDGRAGTNLVLRADVPPEVDALARRVYVAEIAGGEERYAASRGQVMPARVRVRLRDGRELGVEVERPSSLAGSGDGRRRGVVDKFLDASAGVLDADVARECLDLVLRLDELDDTARLMRLFATALPTDPSATRLEQAVTRENEESK